ncbi:MAG: hypothetical protein NTZ30_19645 [Planctomycetota bacterium]|nr:hypothetical protein [Planctomycetota bacterium]
MRPDDTHPMDELLRSYLDHKAAEPQSQILANKVLNKVFAKAELRVSGRAIWRKALWFSGMVAAVLVAFLGGLYLTPVHANPETIVKNAMRAHSILVDRLYLVETRTEPSNPSNKSSWASTPRINYLWTRGNCFWVQPGQHSNEWALGRNDADELWLALKAGNGVGIRMPLNEVPEPVRLTAEMLTMRIEKLLEEVLVDFNLFDGEASSGTHLILATPKVDSAISSRVQSVLLEVDSVSKVVRRVVVERVNQGRPVAQVTFKLMKTGVQPEGAYSLEGHLNADSMIVEGRENPAVIPFFLRFFQYREPRSKPS